MRLRRRLGEHGEERFSEEPAARVYTVQTRTLELMSGGSANVMSMHVTEHTLHRFHDNVQLGRLETGFP